ncbi:MAG: ATP-binding cassette domain-containing protein, partial [Bacilli bacterium]
MAKNINNNEKILDVKDLRISFKTDNGTVKAVRGISFSLYKGKTFAIVGESGSGKSVTSRAILGILANNKIIEGGQILYDGKDLLTLSEDRFTRIRGSKISMIFQDPLSSLNPIMKVGKQLTEPMFLKAKFAKREAKHIVLSLDKSFATISAKNPQFNADIVNRFLADEEKR